MRRLLPLIVILSALPLASFAHESRSPQPDRTGAPTGQLFFGLRQEKEKKLDGFGRGLVIPKDLDDRIRLSHRRHLKALAALPKATEAAYDLRALNLVPPIKNQGNCGSCWDFAGVAAAEGAYIKAGRGTKDNVNWAEQSVLDCGRNGGCNGDWPETTLEQIKNAGIADTDDYPYTGNVGKCKPDVSHTNTIEDYGYVGPTAAVASTQAIKDAIKAYGVISVAVSADTAFSNYRSGIFRSSGPGTINHAVALVGWKDDATVSMGGYWILRNSWGIGWGESGYMRICYGANRVGFGAMFAVVSPGPTPPDPPVPPPPGAGFSGTLTYKNGALVTVTPAP